LAKRSSKEARRYVFAIVDVSVNTAAVSSSVENSGGIVYVCDVPPYLHALITVGNKIGGQRPFHKQQIIGGLQPLESERPLEFAGPQNCCGKIADVYIGVLKSELAVGKVRHKPEIEIVEDCSLKHRPNAAQDKAVY